MPGWGDFIGRGSVGEQLFLWGIMSQVLQALTDPYLTELQQASRETHAIEVLSPAELAAAVVRGILDTDTAHSEARKSGLDAERLDQLVRLAENVPPPEALIELYRRGLIGQEADGAGGVGLLPALTQAGMRPEWALAYSQLAVQNPTWNDALDALLEGQIDEATARHWYTIAGGNPDAFEWLFNARGTAPTPDMLGTMANRGIIPWTGGGADVVSFHQGFLEGPWRNKWEAPMRQLMVYLPPPRTVTALLRAGTITPQRALQLFEAEGLSPEDAAAYVADAAPHHSQAAHELTRAEIVDLYGTHVLTEAQAHDALVKLGYDAPTADVLLRGADVKRTISNTTAAITKVRALFVGRKIAAADAAATLKQLGIADQQASQLVALWDIERTANVKTLSEAQVVAAFKKNIITQDEATAELLGQGYSRFDVWVLLSNASGAPLPDKPAQTP